MPLTRPIRVHREDLFRRIAEWVRRELDAAKISNRVAVKTVSVPSGDQSASSSIISGRLVMFYRDGRAQPTVTVPQFGKS
jgi:hypothetical protein